MRRQPIVKNKHWIGKRASIKSLKRYCMEIWSEFVKTRDNRICIICGEKKYVQAHHLISRKFILTRYDINCGISVCAKHHAMGIVSAHQSPWVIYDWLRMNRPLQYKWFLKNRKLLEKNVVVNANLEFYRGKLKYLLEEFEKNYPQAITTNKYDKFTEEEEKFICKDYVENILSRRDLANKYETNEQVIETILKRNNIKMRSCGTLSKELKNLKAKMKENGCDEPVN